MHTHALKTLLTGLGAFALLISPGVSLGAELNVEAAAAVVGADVGRRWCSNEAPDKAIESALMSYMSRQQIDPGQISDTMADRLGKEIVVEALAYAFQQCPARAKAVFRGLAS